MRPRRAPLTSCRCSRCSPAVKEPAITNELRPPAVTECRATLPREKAAVCFTHLVCVLIFDDVLGKAAPVVDVGTSQSPYKVAVQRVLADGTIEVIGGRVHTLPQTQGQAVDLVVEALGGLGLLDGLDGCGRHTNIHQWETCQRTEDQTKKNTQA